PARSRTLPRARRIRVSRSWRDSARNAHEIVVYHRRAGAGSVSSPITRTITAILIESLAVETLDDQVTSVSDGDVILASLAELPRTETVQTRGHLAPLWRRRLRYHIYAHARRVGALRAARRAIPAWPSGSRGPHGGD